MGASWKLEESRLIQYRATSSAANADSVAFAAGPPIGRIWVITGFSYFPSVAETQVVSINKSIPGVGSFGLLNPVSLNLNPAFATFIEQGMEYTLFPGEILQVFRVTHTAGSTMTAQMQFVEIDQPLYTYEEPQEVVRQKRAVSSIRSAMGGASSRGGGSESSRGGMGGGRGSGIPI
jgi:uncharacterized membrane protein YgcG